MWNDESHRAKPGVPAASAQPPDERRVAAWIGKSLRIEGKIVSSESLTIDGHVEGTIEVGDHSLTIGRGAAVTADLTAKNITISGTVEGNVRAHEVLELHESASVDGDITAPRLRMADGAVITGHIEVGAPRKKLET